MLAKRSPTHEQHDGQQKHLIISWAKTSLSSRLSVHFQRLLSRWTGPPSEVGQDRQRDLLPLPFYSVSAEDIAEDCRARGVEIQRDLDALQEWVNVVTIGFNHLFANKAPESTAALPDGPVTLAQLRCIRHIALSVCVMLEFNPDAVRHRDWAADLASRKVSYEGEDIGHAEKLTVEQVLPGLPPAGVAGSLPAADLATGFVKRALLNPAEYSWMRRTCRSGHGTQRSGTASVCGKNSAAIFGSSA